jgi:hypothetical protein
MKHVTDTGGIKQTKMKPATSTQDAISASEGAANAQVRPSAVFTSNRFARRFDLESRGLQGGMRRRRKRVKIKSDVNPCKRS